MPTATVTDPTVEKQPVDTSQLTVSTSQEENERLYFGRTIYRDYKDSAEGNPLLDIALYIFSEPDARKLIQMAAKFHDFCHFALSSSVPAKPPVDLADYLVRDIEVISTPAEEEMCPPELLIDDYRVESLPVNRKRARALYKKLSKR